MLGTCRLCLNQAELIESHIIPRWAYKRLREAGAHTHPVRVLHGVSKQTATHVKEHLLCGACDQHIGKVEARIADLLAPSATGPRFLDRVGPAIFANDAQLRAVAPGTLNLDDLTFFTASVVWRASVSEKVPQCSLGVPHEDEIRRYLRGEAPFPESAACTILFYDLPPSIDVELSRVFTLPDSYSRDGHKEHKFVIHGLDCCLAVGSRLPAWAADSCIYRGAEKWVFLDGQDRLLEAIGAPIFESRAVGTLGRLIARDQADPER
jgi:hypothetical protein